MKSFLNLFKSNFTKLANISNTDSLDKISHPDHSANIANHSTHIVSSEHAELNNDTLLENQKLSDVVSEDRYLFLLQTNYIKEEGQSNQDYLDKLVSYLNEKDHFHIFASISTVDESEIYDCYPISIYLALPENFNLRLLGTHDGNVRFNRIDSIKPEYILGYSNYSNIELFDPNLAGKSYYFLDSRSSNLPRTSDKIITAFNIYYHASTTLDRKHRDCSQVFIAPFNRIVNYYNNQARHILYGIGSEPNVVKTNLTLTRDTLDNHSAISNNSSNNHITHDVTSNSTQGENLGIYSNINNNNYPVLFTSSQARVIDQALDERELDKEKQVSVAENSESETKKFGSSR